MDKSPLKTLTLEDFLESERHKLTGTLTPVTPETFAKWKKERLDKKAAEDEARKAKEATGRAMFEKGDWEASESESESESEGDEEDGDDDDDDDDDDEAEEEGESWNLEAMRRETERLRAVTEEERVRGGGVVTNGVGGHGVDDEDGSDSDGDGGEEETNGINGHDGDGE